MVAEVPNRKYPKTFDGPSAQNADLPNRNPASQIQAPPSPTRVPEGVDGVLLAELAQGIRILERRGASEVF